MESKCFCLDTSSLIWAMNHAYPIDLFEPFWEKVEDAIQNGVLVSSRAVLDEIKNRDDELFKWAKNVNNFFLPVGDHIAREMPIVMQNCRGLINPSKKKDEADPYIVATAKSMSGIVVTQETPLGDNNSRIKIPDACKILNLDCINLLGMIRELNWRF